VASKRGGSPRPRRGPVPANRGLGRAPGTVATRPGWSDTHKAERCERRVLEPRGRARSARRRTDDRSWSERSGSPKAPAPVAGWSNVGANPWSGVEPTPIPRTRRDGVFIGRRIAGHGVMKHYSDVSADGFAGGLRRASSISLRKVAEARKPRLRRLPHPPQCAQTGHSAHHPVRRPRPRPRATSCCAAGANGLDIVLEPRKSTSRTRCCCRRRSGRHRRARHRRLAAIASRSSPRGDARSLGMRPLPARACDRIPGIN